MWRNERPEEGAHPVQLAYLDAAGTRRVLAQVGHSLADALSTFQSLLYASFPTGALRVPRGWVEETHPSYLRSILKCSAASASPRLHDRV